MHTAIDNPAKLAFADPVRWPLQIRLTNYGWTVTVYNQDGHARHLLTASTEMEAYREAYSLAKIYHVENPVLVTTFKGERKVDLDKMLKSSHKR
jgi:hypothetical protein